METSSTPTPMTSVAGYKIGGISVEFSYKPYGSQLAFMGRVISTLDRATKQEPRGKADGFETVPRSYYESIGGGKVVVQES